MSSAVDNGLLDIGTYNRTGFSSPVLFSDILFIDYSFTSEMYLIYNNKKRYFKPFMRRTSEKHSSQKT